MSKKRLVSFVVLNWNGIEDTLLCLDSIRQQNIKDYEIIVVDNGSAIEQKQILRKISDITLVDLPKNTGFTGGQIAALEKAGGEYIALINNDAVIAPDWAEKAIDTFRANPDAAAAGGRAYDWNDEEGQKPFSKSNSFYSYQVVNLRTGHTQTLRSGNNIVSVDSISGSGVMLSREAIEHVGYFDNRFFAYYEETDLFARMKRAGYKIFYNPEMGTWHKIAQSTRSKPGFYLYYMHRNRFIFAAKNYDFRFMLSFFDFYLTEWSKAIGHVIKRRKKASLEQKMLIKAGLWNFTHILSTLIARHQTQKLGITYSKTLLEDNAEPVTVIIPCYNYAEYVAESIESVMHQTVPPDEIIVIDDGSTDDSLGVIRKYEDKVTVIAQKNKGVIKTKNHGLDIAHGNWIVFLDADDVLEPSYLQELMYAARLRKADIVYSGMRFFGNEKGIFESRPYSEYSLLKGNYINNSAMMKKTLLDEVGGYNEAMHFGFEDWELYVNFANHRARFAYVRKPLLRYRRHGTVSRDATAQIKLQEAHATIQKLHPGLFLTKHKLKNFAYSFMSFFRTRTPWQMIKDVRFMLITRLDRLSRHIPPLAWALGFARLVSRGEFSKLGVKIRKKVGLSGKG